MTTKALPVGIDDFEMLITRGYYYVDKTLFIKELLEKKGAVNLFTRPRRFGKTLNLSMLQYFFENTGNAGLFEDLQICKYEEICAEYMGQYPVIMLSLKSAKQPDFYQAYAALMDDIGREFDRHRAVMESDSLLLYEKEKYQRLLERKGTREDGNTSLKFLSECLYKHYGKKVIILIDEYDVPLENAYMEHFYDEMLSFIRSLFESALKTNKSMEFAVITGCLRISKESIFTGLNNLEIHSILTKSYDEYFGFTEQDMKCLCEDYGLLHKFPVIKEWYNGYVFGNVNVYNPWSTVQYIKALLFDEEEFPYAYWANTSANGIVRKLIDLSDAATKSEIEELIAGNALEKPVHEDITYDEIDKNIDNLFNFMFFTGYFRKVKERIEPITGKRYVTLAIPNEEVRYIFRNKVLGWFDAQVKSRDRSRLFSSFTRSDVTTVEEEIQGMLMDTISFYDAYESFYHGFLTGIFYGMDGYIVKSNRESGSGRTDLFLKPVSRKGTAFVVEFKVVEKLDDLEKGADAALRQITDKRYETELLADGYKNIVCYGISFYRKDCRVKVT